MEFIGKIVAFLQGHMMEAIIAFLYMTVEFWLGKTELVKPGSALEVIFSALKKVLEFLKLIKPKAQ